MAAAELNLLRFRSGGGSERKRAAKGAVGRGAGWVIEFSAMRERLRVTVQKAWLSGFVAALVVELAFG